MSNPGFASFLPTADAGQDQSARLGTTVILDGSGSEGGPWGTNITYYWSVADDQGNPVTDLTRTGGNTATPSFVIPETAPTSGYVFTLTVQGKGHRGGSLYKSTDSISVAVVTPPTVTAVALASAPASGTTYGNGERIEVVVTFGEPATVDISGGTPRIGLTVGTAAKTAGYLRGSGSRRLVFAYEVQASDTDLDGVSVPANSLVRNGGRIVTSDSFLFRLAHEALTDNTDHKVNSAVTPLSGGVCGRTAQVRARLLELVQRNNDTVTNCSQVTTAHLQELTGTLSLTEKGIIVLNSGDFANLANLTGLFLQNNDLQTLPDGIFDGLANLLNLNLQDNDLRTLPDDIFEGLVKLRNLNLYENDLQALPGGIFEGLASLRALNLYENDLQTLPVGIFEGLASLQFLYLYENDLQTLPDGIFEGLAILRTLSLVRNPGFASFLPTADAGEDQNSELGMTVSFDGSASVGGPWGTNFTYYWTVADGQGNPVTDLTLTGEHTATLSFAIPEAAPTSGYVVTLTVVGRGVRYGSTDSVSVAVAAASTVTAVALASAPKSGTTYGNGESIEVVVTFEEPATVDISGGTPRIGLTVGTAVKTAGYTRGSGSRRLVFAYEVQASDTDLDGVSVPADSLVRNGGRIVNSDGFLFRLTHEAVTDNTGHKVNGAVTPLSGGVCGRTAQVRAELLAQVQRNNATVANCSQVTAAHLHALTGTLNLSREGIIVLKFGDFANLVNFTGLSLRNNDLQTLPDGIFEGLANLTNLNLSHNDLQALPADIFDGLANLSNLNLSHNALQMLPNGIFDGLANLSNLNLSHNALQMLPNGIFEGLANLANLNLSHNDLQMLSGGIFDGLASLSVLDLRPQRPPDAARRDLRGPRQPEEPVPGEQPRFCLLPADRGCGPGSECWNWQDTEPRRQRQRRRTLGHELHL